MVRQRRKSIAGVNFNYTVIYNIKLVNIHDYSNASTLSGNGHLAEIKSSYLLADC